MRSPRIPLRKLISNKKVRRFAYLFFVLVGRAKALFESAPNFLPPSTSVANLDVILNRARSFDEFLSNPALLNSYYTELRHYFGEEKFPRPAFDQICKQIRDVSAAHPDFTRKIWNTPFEKRDFKISAFGDSAGRVMNKNLWRIFWRDYRSKIQAQSYMANLGPDEPISERKQIILREIQKYSVLVREFNFSRLSSAGKKLSHKDKQFLDREFFKEQTARPAFRRAVASLIDLFFELPENRQLIYLSDADLLLYFLKELRQNPRKILSVIPHCPNPDGLLSTIRLLLPDSKKLMENMDLFPYRFIKSQRGKRYPVGRSAVSELKTSLLHPVHAIWLGIPGNDCLAGHSESLTPARWLVSASEGSLTHIIEKDGAYQGFVRCTSVTDLGGSQYGSIEIWSPVVIKNILVKESDADVTLRVRPFFEIWFPLYKSQVPKIWQGIVLSESVLIDNLGIKSVIAESSFYKDSKMLGSAEKFILTDHIADEIAHEFEDDEFRQRYGDGVIFDARIRDAGLIRLLNAN